MDIDIGYRMDKPVDEEIYMEVVKWCNGHNATIEDKGDYYEVVAVDSDAEKTALQAEMLEKQVWLSAHDYIGTKIATGRATIEDYAQEIQTMREYAQRIDEIRELLKGDENGLAEESDS